MTKWKRPLKSLAESNFRHNFAADAVPAITTRNKLINDQNGITGNAFRYGEYHASYNACEVIAVHNAKVLLGLHSTLSQTIKDFQNLGIMILNGCFGSNPHRIGKILQYYGIDYRAVLISEMKRPGVYIISYWNKGKPFKGLHTVAVSYDGTDYRTYNLSGNGTVANSLPSCDNRYICGYYLFGNT